MTNRPEIEVVAAKFHEAWVTRNVAKGIPSQRGIKGEELMVPFADLSELAKDIDRATVRMVYEAMDEVAVSSKR